MHGPITCILLKEKEVVVSVCPLSYQVDEELEVLAKCLDSPWECGKDKMAKSIVSIVIWSWRKQLFISHSWGTENMTCCFRRHGSWLSIFKKVEPEPRFSVINIFFCLRKLWKLNFKLEYLLNIKTKILPLQKWFIFKKYCEFS